MDTSVLKTSLGATTLVGHDQPPAKIFNGDRSSVVNLPTTRQITSYLISMTGL
jgi:hypothetical protein